MRECPKCGHSMKVMKFADDQNGKMTCPDCGYRKPEPKFSLGRVVATPDALRAIEAAQEVSSTFLIRHQRGDWGTVDAHDQRANEAALKDGSRIFSAYLLKDGTKIWIITSGEDDQGQRESTTILLPECY